MTLKYRKYELNMFHGVRLIQVVFVLIYCHYVNDLNRLPIVKNVHLCVFID